MTSAKVTTAAARVAAALLLALSTPGTEANIKAAESIVSLRRQFKHEGMPDWAGRSPGYRDLIERLYREAGVPSDSESNLQANLRYHIGNAIRRVAPPEDLEALGMTKAGPLGRIKETRVVERQAKRSQKAVSSTADPAALATLALDAFRAARSINPDGQTAAVRRTLRTLADEIEECLGS